MRGVVLTRPGNDLEIVANLNSPEPLHGQVCVEVAFSGVCHSQLMEARGLRGDDRHVPHLLGHEGTGIVKSIGPGVTKVVPGDRVVLTWIKGQGLDVGGGRYGWNGRVVNAGPVTTFNELAVVSENRVVRLPTGVPMDVGVLLGCALPTGAGVICNTLKPEAGKTLVVYGLGGVGICALAAASRYGLERLIAVDVQPAKLALARDFGATHVIDASRQEPVEVIRGLTASRGADYAIEAAGATATIERAFASVRDDGGRCVFASHPPAGKRICLDPHALIRGRQIEGSWGGGCMPDRDIPILAPLCVDNGLPFESLVRDRYPLAEVNRALADLEARRAMRPLLVVTPDPC